VRNWYPFPHIDDLLDQLKGDKYFSKIDLNFIYQQVPIKKTNGWKTAFKSNYGLFEWLVMPFGLMNFPTNFIRMMDDILCHFTNYFVEVYLVDILIFNKDLGRTLATYSIGSPHSTTTQAIRKFGKILLQHGQGVIRRIHC
jgi:hypothetical protein